MIVNGQALLRIAPIKSMLPTKQRLHGVSHGLTEAGYDIRIKQDVIFTEFGVDVDGEWHGGRFALASTIEEFDMPQSLVGVVHDKSTWARRALSVFNTVIEPGWRGHLTLELVYNGRDKLVIPAGSGIAQVLFHQLGQRAAYEGKYQDQPDEPVGARDA